MMTIVLDTNIVISALFWKGAPARLFEFGPSVGASFFTSAALLLELSDTLSRPKFTDKLRIAQSTAEQMVDRYKSLTEIVIPVPTPSIAPDPDDDVVIGTALAARVDLIVTGDFGLLSVKSFEGGRIVSVGEALEMVGLNR